MLTEITTSSKPLLGLFDAMLGELSKRRDFLEAMHLDAANLHERGLIAAARPMFQYVWDHAREFPDLQAWARFKLAEIDLDSGDVEAGVAGLKETLAVNPQHSKARIMLVPENEPVEVVVGGPAQWEGQGIETPFYYNKPELWKYYFERRPIDVLWVAPAAILLRFDPAVLSHCIENFFSTKGSIKIALNKNATRAFSVDEMHAVAKDKDTFRRAIENALSELCAE